MIDPYVKPDSELLVCLTDQLFAESGNAQGSGQDLTVTDVNPNDLFF
ncbi:MAG: hypothetical protein J5737_02505 [Bacteroidales bacterium]|nr:hypothetical protein [Bacteroidales bacterium]